MGAVVLALTSHCSVFDNIPHPDDLYCCRRRFKNFEGPPDEGSEDRRNDGDQNKARQVSPGLLLLVFVFWLHALMLQVLIYCVRG
jgi:hypothetical protein